MTTPPTDADLERMKTELLFRYGDDASIALELIDEVSRLRAENAALRGDSAKQDRSRTCPKCYSELIRYCSRIGFDELWVCDGCCNGFTVSLDSKEKTDRT